MYRNFIKKIIGCLGLGCLLLTACKKDTSIQSSQTNQLQNQQTQQQTQTSAETAVRRGLVDNCPRLIQKRIDRTQIIRRDSLSENSCDYYIYPQLGDSISVNLSNYRIHATLTQPYVHDFNNGSYLVIANGRHIIRLQNDAFGVRDERLDYIIEIDLQPDAQPDLQLK